MYNSIEEIPEDRYLETLLAKIDDDEECDNDDEDDENTLDTIPSV